MSILNRARSVALGLIATLVLASTSASLAESYRGLVDWSSHHMVLGVWAYIWPLMVDTFVVVGELLLFVGLVDRWCRKNRVFAWVLVAGGLAVSIASNVGHVGANATLPDRLTAAVPPIAAWAALAGALGALKRIVGDLPALVAPQKALVTIVDELEELIKIGPDFERAAVAFKEDIQAGRVPGLKRIRAVCHVGHVKAPKIQKHLKALLAREGLA